jgi:hypothetical protein
MRPVKLGFRGMWVQFVLPTAAVLLFPDARVFSGSEVR